MEESKENQPLQLEQVCNFFRKPSKGKNIRKRTAVKEYNDTDEYSRDDISVVFNKKKQFIADNKLHFSSSEPTNRSSSASESDLEKTKATVFEYEFSKEIQVQNNNKATATLETETDFSRDAHAIREQVLKQAEEALKGKKGKSESDQKLYKGINAYTDYKEQRKAGGSHGPLRASAHIRVSARFERDGLLWVRRFMQVCARSRGL